MRGGGVTWLDAGSTPDHIKTLKVNLYDGTLGIALFYAALSAVGVDPEAKERCHLILTQPRQLLQRLLDSPPGASKLPMPIGGRIGIGSMLYSLFRISTFLDDVQIEREAINLVTLLTEEQIAQDRSYDVLYGAAGAILVLTTIFEKSLVATAEDRDALLAAALACGKHLLASRCPYQGGPASWITLAGRPPLAGFSHGLAGISLALLRLHQITEERSFLNAALDALEVENKLYVPEHQNWHDRRWSDELRFEPGGCVGLAGITLARLKARGILDHPVLRQDLEIGLQQIVRATLVDVDQICCGNLGIADVLISAFQERHAAELRNAAWQLATKVLERTSNLKFCFGSKLKMKGYWDPGFFSGAAGIGYVLLRLSFPARLPSVLASE